MANKNHSRNSKNHKKPNISGLRILQWNCRSLSNKINKLKITATDFDIIMLSETWLYGEKTVRLPNFNPVRKDRLIKNNTDDHGGVCIFIRKKILFEEVADIYHDPKKLESIAIKIKRENSEDILECSVYRVLTESCPWKNGKNSWTPHQNIRIK